nr:reverse transcriptase [Ipomoea batatas]
MGFADLWVRLMKECFSTTGDPLSPYIFLLVVEGLSGMLRVQEKERGIIGVCIARNTPGVNHLFFADDLIIFLKVTYREVGRVKEVLRLFGIASYQAVNYDKLWLEETTFHVFVDCVFARMVWAAYGMHWGCKDGVDLGLERQPVRIGIAKWQKSERGKYKLNVDSSIRLDSNLMGMGWILHDHHGHLVVANSTVREGAMQPRELKRKLLMFAKL